MIKINRVAHAASLLALAAIAWPFVACGLRELSTTQLERALRTAWCGEPQTAATLLGHCAACWSGALVLLVAAMLTIASSAARGSALSGLVRTQFARLR